MRALLINSSDIQGGAARAAYRLHEGLEKIGIDSQILVQNKFSSDFKVIGPSSPIAKAFSSLRSRIDRLPLKLYRHFDRSPWGGGWLPNAIPKKVVSLEPDIVNLHWVCGGFMSIPELKCIENPMVWTLHDMWPFTGGCHYDGGCGKYEEHCGACPQLGSQRQHDLSRWIFKRKQKYWKNSNLVVVTPSKWLAECAMSSSLFRDFRVEVIPNGIDTGRFKPIDKGTARDILGLPREKKLILFGAMSATSDKRKGFHFLKEALQVLPAENNTELVIFGSSQPQTPTNFGMKAYYVGQMFDDFSLVLLYSAADLFVAPSVQDNLPNTIMECLACGTPVVAFAVGGIPDLIDHLANGFLAKPFESHGLAEGISWVLKDKTRHRELCIRARKKVMGNFVLEDVARRYETLYKELLPSLEGR